MTHYGKFEEIYIDEAGHYLKWPRSASIRVSEGAAVLWTPY